MDEVPNLKGMSERLRSVFEEIPKEKGTAPDIIGRICPEHGRWVGSWQDGDPCWKHTWR